MRIDLNIVSYNRPEYLAKMLASLPKQKCQGYQLGSIHLFQDGPKPSRHDEDVAKISECIELFRSTFPDGHIHAADQNIGINGNYRKLWECMATSDSDANIVFEDDLELSPHYLKVMAMLLAHAHDNPHVGLVSAVGALGAPLEFQEQRIKALIPMATYVGVHRWGWGITKEVIREFLPIKRAYFDLVHQVGFLDNGALVPKPEIQKLMLRFIGDFGVHLGPHCMQIDTIYDAAGLVTSRVNLSTYASYAKSIGVMGLHFNEDIYARLGHGPASMVDEVPEEFAWYEPEMMLDVLSLIQRFNVMRNINYATGAYGVDMPFPDVHTTHIIRFLYEQILGWPLTYYDLHAHNLMSRFEDVDLIMPEQMIQDILERDFDETYGLLATAHRKKKSYQFPYAI